MTIATTTTKNSHNGNASATTFAYNFKILDDDDIEVIKTLANGTTTTLTKSTHYTVAGVGADSGSVTISGTALAANESVTLNRKMTFTQPTDLQNQGGFFAEVHETAFDRQAMFALQNQEGNARTLTIPVTETLDMTLPSKDNRKGKILGFHATTGAPEASASFTEVNSLAAITANISTVAGIASNVTAVAGDATDIGAVANKATEIGRLGTSAAVADLAILGTDAIVADLAILGTSDVVADMAILATSDVVTDMNVLATSDIVTDMNVLATSANVTAMAKLGNDATVADMAILGTNAIVADMAILGTDAIVADMAILGTNDVVTDMNILATSDVVTDMNVLATSTNVTKMNTLGTSANVTAMGKLGNDATVADLAILATDAIVADLAILATSDVVSDLNVLATSDVVTDMNTLGTSANVTAMSSVASNIAGVNSFADRWRVASSEPTGSKDEGDLYYNTNTNLVYFYNGSAWVQISQYTHPNHSGDVTSTADGATVIGAGKVITTKILDDNVTAAKLANSINTDIATGVTANTTANAALPKSGGTMTGAITSASDFTIDAAGDINLDADGADIKLKDAGTLFASLVNASGDFKIVSETSDKDMIFRGNDGGNFITALTLDMSEAGKATFNSSVVVGANAVGTLTTDNDGSFAMSASNNFKCTPGGNFALTFTAIVAQSGNILFINSGGHTISAHANTKVDATLLATISTAGTYLLAYFSDGTNVYMTNSAAYT